MLSDPSPITLPIPSLIFSHPLSMEPPNIQNLSLDDDDMGLEFNIETPIEAAVDYSLCLVGRFLSDTNIRS